ncbi:hypothetical protein HispidOSU_024598 [Sigmodon hispidus]
MDSLLLCLAALEPPSHGPDVPLPCCTGTSIPWTRCPADLLNGNLHPVDPPPLRPTEQKLPSCGPPPLCFAALEPPSHGPAAPPPYLTGTSIRWTCCPSTLLQGNLHPVDPQSLCLAGQETPSSGPAAPTPY